MKERLFRYRALERAVVGARPGLRVLDVGCGVGDNLARLERYGGRPFGIDPALQRVRTATSVAPAVVAKGEGLPWADATFDLVYVSHVLHHVPDAAAVLAECRRVLAPGGVLFLLETVEDSPLLRLARAVQPRWDDDDVLHRFRFAELERFVEAAGFRLRGGATFNWLYFLWEVLPLSFRPFELFTPVVLWIELAFRRSLDRYGAHCWLVAEKPGEPLLPGLGDLVAASAAARGASAR